MSMQQQRDAILGYTDQQQAYYIRFIENHSVVGDSYALFCATSDAEHAESIMTTLLLKKSFWLNGSSFQDIVKGLQSIHVH
jgi:hypothetical protein